MDSMRHMYLGLVFVVFLAGCGKVNDLDFVKMNKQFQSEYSDNIYNIKNHNYDISWSYIEFGKKYEVHGSIKQARLEMYVDGQQYMKSDCIKNACGVFGLMNMNFGDLFMKNEQNDGASIKINKKQLVKTINDNFVSKDYHYDKISSDEIFRDAKYVYTDSWVRLDIAKFGFGWLVMSGNIIKDTINLSIKKWSQNIYINGQTSWLHIYSSGLIDIMINRLDD